MASVSREILGGVISGSVYPSVNSEDLQSLGLGGGVEACSALGAVLGHSGLLWVLVFSASCTYIEHTGLDCVPKP